MRDDKPPVLFARTCTGLKTPRPGKNPKAILHMQKCSSHNKAVSAWKKRSRRMNRTQSFPSQDKPSFEFLKRPTCFPVTGLSLSFSPPLTTGCRTQPRSTSVKFTDAHGCPGKRGQERATAVTAAPIVESDSSK